MASYLLLRSNKKSGPYSLQEIVNFGFKAYDLVWVEGKSASWRYPSEVEELKPYTSSIEEQPFDRFFKKPSEQLQEQPVLLQKAQQAQQSARIQEEEQYAAQQKVQVQQPATQVISQPTIPAQEETYTQPEKIVVEEKRVIEQEPLVQQSSYEEQYEKYLPKKSVFVTLPGNKSVVVQKPVEAKQEAIPIPVPPPTPTPTVSWPVTPAATITVKENPEAQIKYSQPLDEIKEMYVKTLQDRKTKMARRSIMFAGLKKAAVIAALVAVGVVTGLIINRNSGKGATLSQTSRIQEPGTALTHEVVPVTDNQPAATEKHSDQSNVAENNTPIQNDLNSKVVNQPVSMPDKAKEQILRQEREQHLQDPSGNNRRENEARSNQPKQVYEERPLLTDPKTGERNRNMRNENDVTVDEERPATKAVMKPRKSGLESLVSVTSNDYKRVAFGGIRNLELTVTNDSKFILDKVTVELQYLKPSEEPLKTELVHFQAVSPNGAMTMKIRDTNRGIKVLYKIIDIQAAGQETALNGF